MHLEYVHSLGFFVPADFAFEGLGFDIGSFFGGLRLLWSAMFEYQHSARDMSLGRFGW